MRTIHYCAFFIVTGLAAYFAPEIIRFSRLVYFEHLSKFTEAGENHLDDEQGGALQILTPDELSRYSGLDGSPGMYLAILGKVYDVIEGAKHYGPGSSYSFFVGKLICYVIYIFILLFPMKFLIFKGRDASKAFISGDFEGKEGVEMDDVLTLTPRDILGLVQWSEFYATRYRFVGHLVGRFYDSNGNPTQYLNDVHKQVDVAKEMRQEDARLNEKFPQCNIEWTADAGTRVWCSSESGGSTRDWVGVPRKYFQPGVTDWRCACVKDEDLPSTSIKEFTECDRHAVSCTYNAENEA